MSSSTGTIALEGMDPRGKQPARINPYWVLVLPLVLFLLVLYLYPIGQVLWISFSDPEVGLQNYERLVTNRGNVTQSLIAHYKAMGGGWQSARRQPLVDDATRDTMLKRSNWQDLLDVPLPAPDSNVQDQTQDAPRP